MGNRGVFLSSGLDEFQYELIAAKMAAEGSGSSPTPREYFTALLQWDTRRPRHGGGGPPKAASARRALSPESEEEDGGSSPERSVASVRAGRALASGGGGGGGGRGRRAGRLDAGATGRAEERPRPRSQEEDGAASGSDASGSGGGGPADTSGFGDTSGLMIGLDESGSTAGAGTGEEEEDDYDSGSSSDDDDDFVGVGRGRRRGRAGGGGGGRGGPRGAAAGWSHRVHQAEEVDLEELYDLQVGPSTLPSACVLRRLSPPRQCLPLRCESMVHVANADLQSYDGPDHLARPACPQDQQGATLLALLGGSLTTTAKPVGCGSLPNSTI